MMVSKRNLIFQGRIVRVPCQSSGCPSKSIIMHLLHTELRTPNEKPNITPNKDKNPPNPTTIWRRSLQKILETPPKKLSFNCHGLFLTKNSPSTQNKNTSEVFQAKLQVSCGSALVSPSFTALTAGLRLLFSPGECLGEDVVPKAPM